MTVCLNFVNLKVSQKFRGSLSSTEATGMWIDMIRIRGTGTYLDLSDAVSVDT